MRRGARGGRRAWTMMMTLGWYICDGTTRSIRSTASLDGVWSHQVFMEEVVVGFDFSRSGSVKFKLHRRYRHRQPPCRFYGIWSLAKLWNHLTMITNLFGFVRRHSSQLNATVNKGSLARPHFDPPRRTILPTWALFELNRSGFSPHWTSGLSDSSPYTTGLDFDT